MHDSAHRQWHSCNQLQRGLAIWNVHGRVHAAHRAQLRRPKRCRASARQAAVSNKEAGGFDPVTEADREAERAIRALDPERNFRITASSARSIGIENAGSSHIWVIDPIDGTRAFISGLPVWGTLVGLTVDGDAVAGHDVAAIHRRIVLRNRLRRRTTRGRADRDC